MCKNRSDIDEAARNTMLLTYVSQSYFNIESYSEPIAKEVQLIDSTNLDPKRSFSTIINVEYSEVELFDS